MLHKRQCLTSGTDEKAGQRWLRCICFGNDHGNVCTSNDLAATADVPCPGAYYRRHGGMKQNGKAGGQRMHSLSEARFCQFFHPLKKTIGFGVPAPWG